MKKQEEKTSAIQFHITHGCVVNGFLETRITPEKLDQLLSKSNQLKDFSKYKDEFDSEDQFTEHYMELIIDFLHDWVEEDLESILDQELRMVVNDIREYYDVDEWDVVGGEHILSGEIHFLKEYLSNIYNGVHIGQEDIYFDVEVFQNAYVTVETVIEDKECFNYSSPDDLIEAKVDQPFQELVNTGGDDGDILTFYSVDVDEVDGEVEDLERFFDTFID